MIATYVQKDDNGELRNEKALLSVLEENQIFIGIERIPEKHEDMPTLSAEYRSVTQEEVEALIESTDLAAAENTEEAYIAAAEEFVSYLGLMSSYAEASTVKQLDDGTMLVTFSCIVDGTEFDGNDINCIFKERKVIGIDSFWLEPMEFSDKKMETISASVALITFMSQREEQEPVTVTGMELVYWIDYDFYEGYETVTDTALPAWRIQFSSGETVYIQAFER